MPRGWALKWRRGTGIYTGPAGQLQPAGQSSARFWSPSASFVRASSAAWLALPCGDSGSALSGLCLALLERTGFRPVGPGSFLANSVARQWGFLGVSAPAFL